MTTQDLSRRFVYNAWANREALRSLRSATGAVPDRAPVLIAHIVAAERIWLARLGHPLAPGDATHPVWPSASLDETDAQLAALADHGRAVFPRLVPDLPVTYTNQRGETFTDAAGDILEHMLLHAHYHRGQIASLLGRAGLTPAVTDFIHWTRTVEPSGR